MRHWRNLKRSDLWIIYFPAWALLSWFCQAQQIENILARRVNGISQNLHRAIISHSKNAHDDITANLIEHARASLIHERSMKRELEAIRADVRAIGQPRAIVPQTSTTPHVRRTTSIEPIVSLASPPLPGSPTTTGPTSPSVSGSAAHSGPPGSNMPTTPIGPSPVAPAAVGNTNGGRPADGTQSMIIPPPATPPAPRSMTGTPAPTGGDPLSWSTPAVGSSIQQAPQETMNGSQPTDRSFTPSSAYRRIDQREAARKLANFL